MKSNIEWEARQNNYFTLRSHDKITIKALPKYLLNILPKDKKSRIIDIGCGFGDYLRQFKEIGFSNCFGIDISNESIFHCLNNKLDVELVEDISAYYPPEKYDFFVMNHVLEHIDKSKIISTLVHIRMHILNENGYGIIVVPNAQSITGVYWAYEDFTHSVLFTSGSLRYVSHAAGFKEAFLIDKDSLLGSRYPYRIIKKIFLFLFKLKIKFWNRVTSSSFHTQSENVYGFEIKMILKK